MLPNDSRSNSIDDNGYLPLIPRGQEVTRTSEVSNQGVKPRNKTFPCYFCPQLCFKTERAVHRHNKTSHPEISSKYYFKRRKCLQCRNSFEKSLNFRGLISHIFEKKCKGRKPKPIIQNTQTLTEPNKSQNKINCNNFPKKHHDRKVHFQNDVTSSKDHQDLKNVHPFVTKSSRKDEGKKRGSPDNLDILKSIPSVQVEPVSQVPPVRAAASKASHLIRCQSTEINSETSRVTKSEKALITEPNLMTNNKNHSTCLSFMCRSRNPNTTTLCKTCRLNKNNNSNSDDKPPQKLENKQKRLFNRIESKINKLKSKIAKIKSRQKKKGEEVLNRFSVPKSLWLDELKTMTKNN